MPDLTVQITADHIAAGVATKCERCPAALALTEATGVQWYVDRYYAFPVNHVHDRERWWRLPDELVCFIARFDTGEPVEPMAFELPAEFAED